MPRKRSVNPRKLPQQDRSRLTVEAIIEATTHILTQEGYDKANTNRIAERAGISIGSLYQYFPNKESLMAALIEQHSNEIAQLVESKLKDLSHAPLEIAIPALIKAVIAATRSIRVFIKFSVKRFPVQNDRSKCRRQMNALQNCYGRILHGGTVAFVPKILR